MHTYNAPEPEVFRAISSRKTTGLDLIPLLILLKLFKILNIVNEIGAFVPPIRDAHFVRR
jgi:hypothetical protein